MAGTKRQWCDSDKWILQKTDSSMYVVAGWAGDTMNYSISSQACTSLSLNNSDSDMNSDTEENDSGVKDLNTT